LKCTSQAGEVIMKQGNRSIRRHHVERLKQKRKGYWGTYNKSPIVLGILVNTAAICSCWGCRNPRHVLKKESQTIQEKKFFQDMGDE
jgi:hypothetical protein